MNFKKVNNIVGWAVGLFACAVYILTTEANGSFWDCGEFVSSCFKVQIPHPPGAPLFVLMGRFFIILFGNNPLTAAKAVNVMSALASGFTILFLFWTITHFARKILNLKTDAILTTGQAWQIMGAGTVGALAYCFSDSFWYSAVEGEVYACSSFFTAIVFWAVLKWDAEADKPGADRWLVLIFFLIGLSIGVHLLSLLDIAAVVMVYYFRRRETFNYALISKWFKIIVSCGGVLAMIAAAISAGPENAIFEKYADQLRNAFGEDVVLSDSTYVGLMLIGTVMGVGILYLIEKFAKKDKKEYYGGMYIFFVIGAVLTGVVQIGVIQYSIAGAGAFDKIFVNNFHAPFFVGFIFFFALVAVAAWVLLSFANKKGWAYLRLGVWCVSFMLIGYSSYVTTMIRSNADPAVDMYNVDNPISLVGYLGRDQYGDFPLLYGQKFTASPIQTIETGEKFQKSNDKYISLGKDLKYVYLPKDKMILPRVWDASNDQYHADYYSYFLGIEKYKDKDGREKYEDGRPNQSDNVKFFVGYQFYWMYFRYFGWNFIGKQNDNQGMYIGNVRDGNWVSGIPLVDNLFYGDQSQMPDSLKNNQAHNVLFGIPFLLGILGLIYHYKKRGDDTLSNFLLFFYTGFAIILYLNQPGQQPRERDYAYVGSFYAFAVWIGLGVMMITAWIQKKTSEATAAIIATIICFFTVPVLMGQQEWDDHDRSNKTLARDLAKDYLESCAPNAILFTFGDNDTYPLWYAQEVEGIRRDVRVINYSLLGIDWYINQMRYKVNKSDAIDVMFTPEQIEGRKRDYVVYKALPDVAADKYYDLGDILKNYVGSDDHGRMEDRGDGSFLNVFPTRKFSVPVDKNAFIKDSTFSPSDSIVSEIKFEMTKGSIYKNDLAVLSVIAANKWKRPIYFSSPFSELGFGKYLRKDGMSYRLVPMEGVSINADWSFNVMMNKFGFGNADKPAVYYDEENRRHLISIRSTYAEIAGYLADKGRKEEAIKLLEKADKSTAPQNFPYGMVSRNNMHNRASLMFMDACYKAGDKTLGDKVSAAVEKDFNQQIKYYNSLPDTKGEQMAQEKKEAENYLNAIKQIKEQYAPKTAADTAAKQIKMIKPVTR